MERVSKPVPGVDADEILRELTVRQHLAPYRRLADVVAEMIERTGACPVAAERAMERLELDGNRPIGRLKRGELIFVVPVVVLGLFGAAAIVLVPRSVTSLGYPTCAALVGVGRWVRDWYRLERSQS